MKIRYVDDSYGFQSLAMAIVRQAVDDWRALDGLRLCECGNVNYKELALFFESGYAAELIDFSDLNADDIYNWLKRGGR